MEDSRGKWNEEKWMRHTIRLSGGFDGVGLQLRGKTWKITFPDGTVVKNLPANAGDPGDTG